MALVQREISRTQENGLCVVSIEFDDTDGRIQRVFMRGSINDRSVVTVRGGTDSRSDGLKGQPEVVINLLLDNIFMVDEAGVWKRPSWLGVGMDNLEPNPAPARVTERRGRTKPSGEVRERTR